MAENIAFPQNKRRQVAALDIIEAVLHGLGKAGSRNDKECVRRMWKQREEIILKMFFGRTDFLDTAKKQAAYARTILAGCDFIDSEFDRLGVNSNDRVWCNMLCGVLEVTWDSLPEKCPKDIKAIWDRMRGTAFTIYQHQDPDIEAVTDMDEGYHIARNLISVMVDAMEGGKAA